MGDYYRTYLDKNGLFDSHQCADHVSIWADRDERTLMTAHALWRSLSRGERGCSYEMSSVAEKVDPLFHPTRAIPQCHFDPVKVKECVGDIGKLAAELRPPLSKAQNVLNCCSTELCRDPPCSGSSGECIKQGLSGLNSCVGATEEKASIEGGLGIGQSFAEILLLEYMNGFRDGKFGFGRTSYGLMLQALALHARVFNALERCSYIAQRQGDNMLPSCIRDQLRAGPKNSERREQIHCLCWARYQHCQCCCAVKFHWTLPAYGPDEDDDMPPGGALIFEVRETASGVGRRKSIYAFAAQAPDGLHPVMVPVSIPNCGFPDGPCTVDAFWKLAMNTLSYDANKDCVTDWRLSSMPTQ